MLAETFVHLITSRDVSAALRAGRLHRCHRSLCSSTNGEINTVHGRETHTNAAHMADGNKHIQYAEVQDKAVP